MKSFFLFLFGASVAFAALSENVHDNFTSSCIEGGSSPEFCECVFSKVERRYSQKQIDAIELKMRRGKSDLNYTNFIKKASQECDNATTAGSSLGAMAVSEYAEKPEETELTPEEIATLQALGFDATVAAGFLNALMESPEYKAIFTAECAAELHPFLSPKDAAASCECSYQNLLSNGNLQKILSAIDQNGQLNDSLPAEVILTCLPDHYTPEMEKFLMDSCKTAASEPICRCILQDIKAHLPLQELLRHTISDPGFIQGYTTGAAIKCKDK